MAANVGSLIASLTVQDDGLASGLNKAALRIDNFERAGTKRLGSFSRSATNSFIGAEVASRRMNLGLSKSASVAAGFGRSLAFAAVSALSLSAVVAGARSAIDAFGKTSDDAANTGFDVEFLQGLQYQAGLAGVEVTELSSALATFSKNAGLAAEGKGRMVAALKALDPVLLENIRKSVTQEQRLKTVIDALSKETDAARRAAIATAAFGDSGAKIAVAFAGGSAEIDKIQLKARQLGLVVDRELINRADALSDEFGVMTKIVDLQLKVALTNLGPTLVWLAGLAANVTSQVNHAFDGLKPLAEQMTTTLEGRLEGLKIQEIGLPQAAGIDPATAQAEREQILAELRRRAIDNLRTQLTTRPPTGDNIPTLDEIESRNAAAAAAIRQAEAVKKLVDDLLFEKSLIGKSAVEQRTATALRQAGAAATAEQRAQIVATIAAIDAENAALDRVKEQFATAEGLAQSFASSLLDSLDSGKSLAESLAGAFGNLRKQLLQMATDKLIKSLFANLLGMATGGLGAPTPRPTLSIGGLALYDRGGFTGPGPRLKPAGLVHKGEFVTHAAATTRHRPLLEAINRGLPNYDVGGYVGPRMSMIRNAGNVSSSVVTNRGGPVSLIVQVNGASGDPHIKALARAGAQEALSAYDRLQLPKRVSEINRDPRAVG